MALSPRGGGSIPRVPSVGHGQTLPPLSLCRKDHSGYLRAQRKHGMVVRCEASPACEPGKTTIGFVGMGVMGVPMVSYPATNDDTNSTDLSELGACILTERLWTGRRL
jgi:hypothetical protein